MKRLLPNLALALLGILAASPTAAEEPARSNSVDRTAENPFTASAKDPESAFSKDDMFPLEAQAERVKAAERAVNEAATAHSQQKRYPQLTQLKQQLTVAQHRLATEQHKLYQLKQARTPGSGSWQDGEKMYQLNCGLRNSNPIVTRAEIESGRKSTNCSCGETPAGQSCLREEEAARKQYLQELKAEADAAKKPKPLNQTTLAREADGILSSVLDNLGADQAALKSVASDSSDVLATASEFALRGIRTGEGGTHSSADSLAAAQGAFQSTLSAAFASPAPPAPKEDYIDEEGRAWFNSPATNTSGNELGCGSYIEVNEYWKARNQELQAQCTARKSTPTPASRTASCPRCANSKNADCQC